MSRVTCGNCKGQFVECSHQVMDMKTLDISYYCSPNCLKQALEKELKPFGKEK